MKEFAAQKKNVPKAFLIMAAQFLIVSAFISLYVVPSHAGLDAPHNSTNGIGCENCHDVTSNLPFMMPAMTYTPQDIDDNPFNALCWSCHNNSTATLEDTHSSIQTDNDYGAWTVECRVCHNPHTQNQKQVYGSSYGKYIRTKIDLSKISGAAKTSIKTVKFIGATGANSFADGDTTYDGICEVCHTETKNPVSQVPRFRNSGNADISHYPAKQCSLCHDHKKGFKAECDTCHDFPPGLLVSNPAPTGSTTAGAHTKHVTDKEYNCDTCHLGSYGKASSHNNSFITMGFSLFDEQYQGGAYDGQTSADYDAAVTTPATTVSKTGAKTCTNIFCHGRKPDGTLWGGGVNTTPVWTDVPGTVSCGDCHRATAASPPPGGSHSPHTKSWASFGGGYQYPCSFCHKDPTTDESLHGDNKSEVVFSADPMTTGGIYSGNQDMLGSYGTCTMVYCHSTVQSSPPGGAPVYRTTPTWGTSMSGCGNCHNYSDSGLSTGSHAPHFYSYDNRECYTCHNYTSTDDACFACHDDPTGVPKSTHANHNIEVNFLPMLGGSYSGTGQPGDVYGSCANTYCHGNYNGSGKKATPTWGSAATGACGTCHGASNSQPPDFEDSVDWKEGHVLHAYNGEDWSWQTWPREYACTTCHQGIVGGTGPDNYTIIDGEKHVSKTVDWKFDTSDPRLDSGAAYSIASGTQEPSDGTTPRAYGTCSNVYCHSNVQPANGIGPPSVYDTPQWSSSLPACTGCHSVAYHSTGMSSGSHIAHVQGYYFAQGTTASPKTCTICHKWNPSASRTSCGQQCHDTYEKIYHVNGVVDVLFDSFANLAAVYNGTPAPGDGFGSCSNTYCHSNGTSVSTGSIVANTSALWGSAPQSCTSCHANGPDYANGSPKANSHQAVAHSGYTCNFCHFTTTNDGSTIASKVTHVNQIYDVDPGGGASFTYTYNAGGGTCSSVSCHSGGVTRTWGQ